MLRDDPIETYQSGDTLDRSLFSPFYIGSNHLSHSLSSEKMSNNFSIFSTENAKIAPIIIDNIEFIDPMCVSIVKIYL